jgi:hypothetical protein
MKFAIGDHVRVHFHAPSPTKSFSEGALRRVRTVAESNKAHRLYQPTPCDPLLGIPPAGGGECLSSSVLCKILD